MTSHVDSSGIVKLLVREAESDALRRHLAAEGAPPLTSALAETELRRAAQRAGISQSRATAVLDRFDIVDLDRTVFAEAGLLPGTALRSLDAIHLAVALRAGVEVFVTYDERQAAAAAECGLRVLAPA